MQNAPLPFVLDDPDSVVRRRIFVSKRILLRVGSVFSYDPAVPCTANRGASSRTSILARNETFNSG